MQDKFFVVSDIGGTNARFELWRPTTNKGTVQVDMPYRNTYTTISFKGVTHLLEQFLKDCAAHVMIFQTPCQYVLGIRGPVWEEGRRNHPNNVVMTDGTRWGFEHADNIEENLKLAKGSVLFMNDFQAIGYCLAAHYDEKSPPESRPAGITVLHDVPPVMNAAAACIGAGTGMGACYLAPSKSADGSIGSIVMASEFGGADLFSCRDDFEWALLKWLREKYGGYLEVERVVCGGAIVDIFEFFLLHTKEPTDATILKEIRSAAVGDQAALISKYASEGEKNCLKVIDFFLEQYGRLLGNAAVTWVSYRGLFIAGGILSKLSWRWGTRDDKDSKRMKIKKDSNFLKAYLTLGHKMSGTVERVPLILLEDEDAGLKGCLFAALSRHTDGNANSRDGSW